MVPVVKFYNSVKCFITWTIWQCGPLEPPLSMELSRAPGSGTPLVLVLEKDNFSWCVTSLVHSMKFPILKLSPINYSEARDPDWG
ncbi:hypothetical protein J6590_095999 [Homalodisca vitripennis]|nr:hypothetical protein J6590_095999 [Homalodisca vitripennis]